MSKKAIVLVVLAGFATFLIVLLLFWGGEGLLLTGLGANSGANTLLIRTFMAAGTALGIMSKLTYDFISSPSFYDDVAKTNRRQATVSLVRSVLLSAILSPIVIYAVYKTLAEIDDSMLAFLICYQNGFFFQTILASRKAN
jgi:hypothetical protein